jgi:hypothetical protein
MHGWDLSWLKLENVDTLDSLVHWQYNNGALYATRVKEADMKGLESPCRHTGNSRTLSTQTALWSVARRAFRQIRLHCRRSTSRSVKPSSPWPGRGCRKPSAWSRNNSVPSKIPIWGEVFSRLAILLFSSVAARIASASTTPRSFGRWLRVSICETPHITWLRWFKLSVS